MKKTPGCRKKSGVAVLQSGGVKANRSPVEVSAPDKNFTTVLATIIAGLLFGVLLAHAVSKYYHPELEHLLIEGRGLVTPLAAGSLAPEPVERLQYILCMLLVPVFLVSFYFCFERRRICFPEALKRHVDFSATVFLSVVAVFASIYVYRALENTEGGFLYVRAGVLFVYPWVYAVVVYPLLVLLVVYSSRLWVLWVGRVVLGFIGIFVSVASFFSAIYDRDGISIWSYHFNPVIYPVAQVVSSKTLLVDGSSLYGLYPHFLEPFFRIFPLNVHSFTLVMAGLLLVCFCSLWFFLSKLVKNEIIFYAGFIAAVFYSHIGVKMLLSAARPDPYFQYAPLRMLFPCLMLVSSMAYLLKWGGRWMYAVNFCVAGLAILWNPDTGIVVFGAWVLLLIYIEFFGRSFAVALMPALRHAVVALFVLLMLYLGYGLFAFLRSGAWPDWGMAQKYYKLFSYYGYFMLPMKSLPHVWGVVVVIYIISMAISIRGLFRGGDMNFHGGLFILTILGVGLFAYYQGRSHDNCLIPLLCVPILILTLFTDRIFSGVVRRDFDFVKLIPLGGLCFYFCASAAPSVIMQHAVFSGWIKEGWNASPAGYGVAGRNSENINFIKKHVSKGEKIFILVAGSVDGIYYAESSTVSALDVPSSTDWFFRENMDEIIHFILENDSVKIFAVPGGYSDLEVPFGDLYRIAAQEPKTGLVMYLPLAKKIKVTPVR